MGRTDTDCGPCNDDLLKDSHMIFNVNDIALSARQCSMSSPRRIREKLAGLIVHELAHFCVGGDEEVMGTPRPGARRLSQEFISKCWR
jgi:hypothetical protein